MNVSTASDTQPQERWQVAGLTRNEVTNEAWREYIYADGFVYRVEKSKRVYVRKTEKGDSHRVVDSAGVVHYVPVGWRIIRWVAHPEVEF